MKRFWKQAEPVFQDGQWAVMLDGRPVRTPARVALAVPTEALARAIADEWNGVADRIEPRGLPLTGLANAAIDRVSPDRESFATGLGNYAKGDLACYRVEGPAALVARQEKHWDALLGWARRRYDVDFRTTVGIVHVDQPAATVEQLTHALAVLDPFRLAGLASLVTIGGSLVAALAVLDMALPVADAWEAVTVDDRWQLEQWGADAEAEEALENRRRDFFAAAHFLKLLSSGVRPIP
ncbi:MAG TPA: ATP12 family protein [Sphingomicrobium sp.]|nr:ATP12 family protein [Sphingomicrobium sp.]